MKAINYPLIISIGIAIALHHYHGQQTPSHGDLGVRSPWTQTQSR